MSEPRPGGPLVGKRHTWRRKFATAFRGLLVGVRGQRSFLVHLPVALGVVAWGVALRVDVARLAVLLLCVGLVCSAELLNSAVESLARSVTAEYDPHIRDALDIAAGAVLAASLVAVAVGALVLVPPLWAWLAN